MKYNKKLYNSIMESVAKTVKRCINESIMDEQFDDTYYADLLIKTYGQDEELSLYGEFEVEDEDGWCTYELDSVFADANGELMVNYNKIVTDHESHSSDSDFCCRPLMDLNDEIIEHVCDAIAEECE